MFCGICPTFVNMAKKTTKANAGPPVKKKQRTAVDPSSQPEQEQEEADSEDVPVSPVAPASSENTVEKVSQELADETSSAAAAGAEPASAAAAEAVNAPADTQTKAQSSKSTATCAYTRLPMSLASPPSDDEAEEQKHDLPLQTYCRVHEDDAVMRLCAHRGCKEAFHELCCATISFAHGLRTVEVGKNTKMFCPKHHKDLQKQHDKARIMFHHLTLARDKYLSEQAAADNAASLGEHKLRVCALVSDMDLSCLVSSVPVTEGGFAQRNVATEQASAVEKLMHEYGYNILAGNLALAEIPYSEAEVADLKKRKLVPDDWTPPTPLVEMDAAKNNKDGSWVISFTDPALRMGERRFAIIDGNNRVVALIRICAEKPDFLAGTSLNAYLVDLNIHDGLAVQLASIRCNTLSHANIEDTIGDRLQQYMSVIDIYNKMMKKKRLLQAAKSKSKAKPAAPKVKQTDIVNWIQDNGKDLIDLLPRDAQVGTLQFDKGTGNQVHFKRLQLQAWVRLALKADKPFVAWLQQRYAAHQSGAHQMTKGEQKLLVHHYIKMDAVWDSGDPIKYLEGRAAQLDVAIGLQASSKQWGADRRARLADFLGYGADQMVCAHRVMQATPILVAQMERQLAKLATDHKEDKDLLALVPHPASDHPDHKLTVAMEALRRGDRCFDLFCILWDQSKLPPNGPTTKKAPKREYVMPNEDATTFEVKFLPRQVLEAYHEVGAKIGKVTEDRKRAAQEAIKQAEIERKKQEAIEAAEAERQKALQEAQAKAAASVAVHEVASTSSRVSRGVFRSDDSAELLHQRVFACAFHYRIVVCFCFCSIDCSSHAHSRPTQRTHSLIILCCM